jgi:hypothetical protein
MARFSPAFAPQCWPARSAPGGLAVLLLLPKDQPRRKAVNPQSPASVYGGEKVTNQPPVAS